MKRRIVWFALPLVLAALMLGVKWRAEHPTPTKEDLAIRALMRKSSRTVISYYPLAPTSPVQSAEFYTASFSPGELQPFIECFYVSRKTSRLALPPLNFYGSIVITCYGREGRGSETAILSCRIDPDNHQGSVIVARSNRRSDSEVHPVTIKRWIELLLPHPRIGPELRARMKS